MGNTNGVQIKEASSHDEEGPSPCQYFCDDKPSAPLFLEKLKLAKNEKGRQQLRHRPQHTRGRSNGSGKTWHYFSNLKIDWLKF